MSVLIIVDGDSKEQIEKLERHSKLLYSDVATIETCGGGSVRCMMGEVFKS